MGIEEGYFFRPTDGQIMKCLLNKVTGSRSLGWRCGDDVIRTDDLYGSKEPWEVFGVDRKDKEKLFFTELRRVGKNRAGRICRNVGLGFWSNKGQKIWVRGQKGGLIGYKRTFRYERKKKGGQMMNSSDCDWLLKEYLLTVKRGVKPKYANYALCVLKWRNKKKEEEKGSPTEDEISAAADVEVTGEWLRQELGDDDLIDDDDAPGDDDRAVPIVDDCRMQEVDEWILEDDRPLFEEECSVPFEDSSSSAQLLDKSPVIESSSPVDDEWLDGDVEEECSILAAAAAATAPPIVSRKDFDFDFGDYRCDQFAAWDVFCDPRVVGTQQMQMMLPVV